jgi:hypothetical protein
MTSLLVQAVAPDRVSPLSAQPKMLINQVDARDLAKELLNNKDFKCWDQLMTKESHWNDSKNPVSSAEGIGQLLDGTMENLGMKRSDAPAAQMVAALAYLGRHYGSGGACKAWNHWLKHKYW